MYLYVLYVAVSCFRFDMFGLAFFYLAFLCWAHAEVLVQGDEKYRWQPRNEWESDEPTLLAEGLYAWATVFAFIKIMYFLQIDSALGPLQVRK